MKKEKKFKTSILEFPSTILLFGHSFLEGWDIILHLPTGLACFSMVPVGGKSIIVFMFLCFCCRQHLRAGWTLCMQLSIPDG